MNTAFPPHDADVLRASVKQVPEIITNSTHPAAKKYLEERAHKVSQIIALQQHYATCHLLKEDVAVIKQRIVEEEKIQEDNERIANHRRQVEELREMARLAHADAELWEKEEEEEAAKKSYLESVAPSVVLQEPREAVRGKIEGLFGTVAAKVGISSSTAPTSTADNDISKDLPVSISGNRSGAASSLKAAIESKLPPSAALGGFPLFGQRVQETDESPRPSSNNRAENNRAEAIQKKFISALVGSHPHDDDAGSPTDADSGGRRKRGSATSPTIGASMRRSSVRFGKEENDSVEVEDEGDSGLGLGTGIGSLLNENLMRLRQAQPRSMSDPDVAFANTGVFNLANECEAEGGDGGIRPSCASGKRGGDEESSNGSSSVVIHGEGGEEGLALLPPAPGGFAETLAIKLGQAQGKVFEVAGGQGSSSPPPETDPPLTTIGPEQIWNKISTAVKESSSILGPKQKGEKETAAGTPKFADQIQVASEAAGLASSPNVIPPPAAVLERVGSSLSASSERPSHDIIRDGSSLGNIFSPLPGVNNPSSFSHAAGIVVPGGSQHQHVNHNPGPDLSSIGTNLVTPVRSTAIEAGVGNTTPSGPQVLQYLAASNPRLLRDLQDQNPEVVAQLGLEPSIAAFIPLAQQALPQLAAKNPQLLVRMQMENPEVVSQLSAATPLPAVVPTSENPPAPPRLLVMTPTAASRTAATPSPSAGSVASLQGHVDAAGWRQSSAVTSAPPHQPSSQEEDSFVLDPFAKCESSVGEVGSFVGDIAVDPAQHAVGGGELPKRHETPEEEATRARLVRFFKCYNAENLPHVDKVLDLYKGRETKMFENLVKKFGPEPPRSPITHPLGAPNAEVIDLDDLEDYPGRIINMYTVYVPEKLEQVSGHMDRFKGREQKLLGGLVDRYGPEPNLETVEACKANPPRYKRKGPTLSADGVIQDTPELAFTHPCQSTAEHRAAIRASGTAKSQAARGQHSRSNSMEFDSRANDPLPTSAAVRGLRAVSGIIAQITPTTSRPTSPIDEKMEPTWSSDASGLPPLGTAIGAISHRQQQPEFVDPNSSGREQQGRRGGHSSAHPSPQWSNHHPQSHRQQERREWEDEGGGGGGGDFAASLRRTLSTRSGGPGSPRNDDSPFAAVGGVLTRAMSVALSPEDSLATPEPGERDIFGRHVRLRTNSNISSGDEVLGAAEPRQPQGLKASPPKTPDNNRCLSPVTLDPLTDAVVLPMDNITLDVAQRKASLFDVVLRLRKEPSFFRAWKQRIIAIVGHRMVMFRENAKEEDDAVEQICLTNARGELPKEKIHGREFAVQLYVDDVDPPYTLAFSCQDDQTRWVRGIRVAQKFGLAMKVKMCKEQQLKAALSGPAKIQLGRMSPSPTPTASTPTGSAAVVQEKTPTAKSNQDAKDEFNREILFQLYTYYEPHKVASFDKVVGVFKGRESDVIKVLLKKYGSMPPSWSERIQKMTRKHCPQQEAGLVHQIQGMSSTDVYADVLQPLVEQHGPEWTPHQ